MRTQFSKHRFTLYYQSIRNWNIRLFFSAAVTMIEDLDNIACLVILFSYFILVFCAIISIYEAGCNCHDEQIVMEMKILKETPELDRSSREKTFNALYYRNIYGNTTQTSEELVNSQIISDAIRV